MVTLVSGMSLGRGLSVRVGSSVGPTRRSVRHTPLRYTPLRCGLRNAALVDATVRQSMLRNNITN
jgi:hypothetical protein